MKNNLYGLVLTGGKSTRMKTDKSSLQYHGKEQALHACELLAKFCDRVFISSRKDSSSVWEGKGFPLIHDHAEFADVGPLGGILSALSEHPHTAWLALACDLPFVREKTLQDLLEQRDPHEIATAYRSVHDQLPEPLCTIYEPHAFPHLLSFFQKGIHCPRKFLINSNIRLLDPEDKMFLDNVNNPEEFQQAVEFLKKKEKEKENP